MNPCQARPIPQMHVFKNEGMLRKNWFLNKKYKALSDHIGKKEKDAIFYEASNFLELLDTIVTGKSGLRIYIASYPDEDDSDVPKKSKKELTLIYAPTDVNRIDMGDYYIINEGANYNKIDLIKAKKWVEYFKESKLRPVLNKLFPFPDGDTRSLYYDIDIIREFRDEIRCQKATGIRAYFSSYTDSETVPLVEYRNQLIIQFVLTEKISGKEQDFYIEDRPGFGDRPGPAFNFMDTGSPCPPANCRSLSI